MNRETLHIDDLLNRQFGAFEPAVPAMAWEGINAALDQKERKGILIWWKVAVVFIVALSLFEGGRRTLNHFSHNRTAGAASGAQHANPSSAPAIDNQNTGSHPSEQVATGNQPSQGGSVASSHHSVSGSASTHHTNTGIGSGNGQPDADGSEHTASGETNTQTENEESHSYRQFDLNDAKGISSQKVEDPSLNEMLAKQAVENGIKARELPVRPVVEMGRLQFGLGVGQLVSNTGYSINPEYKNYVHPNYLKEMSAGEGILSSLSFNSTLAYKISTSKPFYLFTGLSFYQRKNSLNFNFDNYYIARDLFSGAPKDKLGKSPLLENNNPVSNGKVTFKGTNTFTQFEIPVGAMYDVKLGNGLHLMPSVSANLGILSQSGGNKTLDYQMDTITNIDPSWYRNTYYTLNASLGVYKDLGRMFRFGVSASTSYMLTPVYVPGFTIRPRAFTGGLSTQLIWRLD